MKKIVFTILIGTLSIFSYGQSIVDNSRCEELKQQKIDFSDRDIQYIQQQIFKLIDCGFDSIDCKIVGPIIGNMVVHKLSTKGDTAIKYSFIVELLNQLRNSPEYLQLRREIIDGSKVEEKIPVFLNIHRYFNYEEAVKSQAVIKKPLLIYFTSKYSVTSRRMEKDVLRDTSIIRLLNNFMVVTLYVDDDKMGKMNAELQEVRYKSNSQPEFINQPFEGKWTKLDGYVSKEEFVKFLNL